jgi:tetratricopeptide (TPR) repeat protein
VWPDLDAPCYADAGAAVERLALKGWGTGRMTPDAPAPHTSAAGRYLAADVTYLRSLLGQIPPLDAIAAYARALRTAPTFPDAPRALVMIGFASLRLGLAPEADIAFDRVLGEYPTSRYTTVAKVGRAAALRQRRRFDEARGLLDSIAMPVAEGVRCEVVAERAGLARGTGHHADAVPLDETIARDCPRFTALPATTLDRADSLLAVGRRQDARALLAKPPAELGPTAQATLLARAAKLAREDGDLSAARAALEGALGLRIGPGARTGLQARLARLDGVVSPARAIATLEALAIGAPSATVYADVVGLVAETLADTGRYGEALARLEALDGTPMGEGGAALAHREAVLAHWIDRLSAAGDPTGVASVFARHRTMLETHASPETARRIAEALTRVGLPEAALRVLRMRDPGDDPAHTLAVGTAALEVGDVTLATDAVLRLDRVALPPDVAAARTRLAGRLAARDGHPERVVADAASDPALARDLTTAWTARGDLAAASSSWDAAADAYARARALAPDDRSRLVATAGIVRARAATGADPAVTEALATIDDATLRRGLALVATTRDFGAVRETP